LALQFGWSICSHR